MLRLRLRRRGHVRAAGQDVHARPRLHPAVRARGRTALPRRVADRVAAERKGIIRAEALKQKETFEAAVLFARTEGIIPAPESAHAIASAIREAKKCKETGQKKVILFNLSGHGHFDMSAYEQYFAGKIEDYEYPEEAIRKAEQDLPKLG